MRRETRCFYKIANRTEKAKIIRGDKLSHGDCESCDDRSETATYCRYYTPIITTRFEENYENVGD